MPCKVSALNHQAPGSTEKFAHGALCNGGGRRKLKDSFSRSLILMLPFAAPPDADRPVRTPIRSCQPLVPTLDLQVQTGSWTTLWNGDAKAQRGRKEEWKRSLYGRGLRWVKICAFSNLEVLSTSSSCSCTGCVEAVLTAKWHPSLDLQSETLHCVFENTDQLMIPLLLEMDGEEKV